jgi:hypothetical protein
MNDLLIQIGINVVILYGIGYILYNSYKNIKNS